MTVKTAEGCDQEACQFRRLERISVGLATNDEKCIHFGDNCQCDRETEIAKRQTLIALNNTLGAA